MTGWRDYMEVSRAVGRQDFAAVAAACERIIGEHPADSFALGMLAQAYAALGRRDEALLIAERALALTPRLFSTLQLAATIAATLGDHARARAFVTRALAADPHEFDIPRPFVSLVRLLARIPGIRRCFNPERVAELEPARTEKELAEWRSWAEQYLASSEPH